MNQIYMNAMIVGKAILEAADPEAEFSEFYSLIKAAQPADQDLPHELRVMALMLAAGTRQEELVSKCIAATSARGTADKRAQLEKNPASVTSRP
jgi:hypothetical protein